VRLPIRVRLTAWYTLILVVLLTVLGGYLVQRMRAGLAGDVDRSLASRSAQIAASFRTGAEFTEVSNAALSGLSSSDSGAQLLSTAGTVVGASDDLIARAPMITPAQLAEVVSGQTLLATGRLPGSGAAFRLLARTVNDHGQVRVLVVGTSLAVADAAVHRLMIILLTGGPLVLLVAAATGWWVAGLALRPVAAVTDKAREISVDRLDERVPVPGTADEVGRLAETFNAMLDRLEAGVETQRRLVADASHELRTPLAVMRSELDVALAAGDLAPDAAEVLASTAEEVERMSRMVDNLLALAQADQGGLDLFVRPVDLRDVAEATVLKLRSLAAAKGLTLEVTGGAPVVDGDRERLAQVVTNLLDNAVKYTARGGVRLHAWREGDEAGITVTDTGPGIPPDELTRVFGRFYRADTARSRAVDGTGLGLAIAQEIVHAHGGRIWADQEPGGGTRITFALPVGNGSG
jgi:two-component system, OmpR family, sensor kinase